MALTLVRRWDIIIIVKELGDMGKNPKRSIKDSVFTNIFKDKKYVVQLYKALFPDSEDITEDDVTILTLENILMNSMYNDLGFMVKNRLIVLAEAQSTWSLNILVRMLLYITSTYKDYIGENNIDLYTSKKAVLPKPELFVIYTGDKKLSSNTFSLADEFFDGERVIDINVKVLTTGQNNDIIYQYVTFTKVLNEQIKIHGRNERAVIETIRICKDTDILKEYLSQCEEEVIDMMCALFDTETLMKVHDHNLYKEALEQGIAQGVTQGVTQGRDDLLAALREMGVDEATLQKAAARVKAD
ncbi:MAG: hypothetical protein ACI38A_11875 [Candidatus Ornithomonoglobus sp.]